MKVTKAVITAAGPGQGQIPFQTLINRNGEPCSTLSVQLAELSDSGIREVALVIRPDTDEEALRVSAGATDLSISFVRQDPAAKGFGHAILTAAKFTSGEPFLLMVGDHIYVSDDSRKTCAAQLIEVANREECIVSALQSTHESQLNQFGTIGGSLVGDGSAIFEVTNVKEKPTPTYAEQHLLVPGQRLGHYLCFFGMHVLTPDVLSLLKAEAEGASSDMTLGLSDSLDQASRLGKYLGVTLRGARFNLEQPYGQLKAQIAIGLQSRDRDQLLADMIELLAPIRSQASES